MRRPRALDLYCRAGGVSEGLLRAGFDVVGVDILDCSKAYNRGPGDPGRHERPAKFVQADALDVLEQFIGGGPLAAFLGQIDFIWASPPCQAHTILRKLQPGKKYPDLIPQTRERLKVSGIPYCIENVPGAPVAASIVLCGTMFGLQTPDGRAELWRHRLFETSWPIALRPACQHRHKGIRESLTVTGTGMGPGNRGKEAAQRERRAVIPVTGHTPVDNRNRRGREAERLARRVCGVEGEVTSRDPRPRVITVTGNTAQTNLVRNTLRETFSTDDARAAMGIDWMAMKDLSQAIPPVYAEFLGRMFLGESPVGLLTSGGCQASLF